MRNKPKFNCVCGHEEKIHNFDPDSMFFGCTHKFYTSISLSDNTAPLENYAVCRCNEFRPDNLKYLEDVYETSGKKL